MNGIALTVLISQLPKLLGFSIEGDGPLRELLRPSAQATAGRAAELGRLRLGAGTLAVHPAAQALQARARAS